MLSCMSLCTGFLCVLRLQTKCRCFLCLCLIIIRGAQLLSAPLLTLFSQQHWSALSRPHQQSCHVHIQTHYLVIRNAVSWFDHWDESQGKQSDSQVSSKQNGFQLRWLLSSRLRKGTLLLITMLFLFCLSQPCQVMVFLSCGEGASSQPGW